LLLAEWAHRSGAADTAWVSLDADDNEECRFWSAFLDALAACPSVPG
jgi:LuxR family maltose regulon positive regulatory protein